jgi:hypothetical protein
MKNFKNFMVILITFAALLFLTNSCTKTKEKPECERNNTGTIKIVNNAPFVIYVDVTENKLGYNDERLLGIGQSTTYTMPEGTVYCYAASMTNYSANKWNEKIETCTECQTFTLTWTSNGKSYSVNDNNINSVMYNEIFNISGEKAKQ